jgi:hypothetical protein
MTKILEFLETDFTYQEPSKEQRLQNSKIFRFSNSTPFLPQSLVKKLMPQIPCASDFDIPERTNKSTQYFNIDQDNNNAVHKHVVCNDCKAYPIIGTRYKCLDIDMDLCSKCITK